MEQPHQILATYVEDWRQGVYRQRFEFNLSIFLTNSGGTSCEMADVSDTADVSFLRAMGQRLTVLEALCPADDVFLRDFRIAILPSCFPISVTAYGAS